MKVARIGQRWVTSRSEAGCSGAAAESGAASRSSDSLNADFNLQKIKKVHTRRGGLIAHPAQLQDSCAHVRTHAARGGLDELGGRWTALEERRAEGRERVDGHPCDRVADAQPLLHHRQYALFRRRGHVSVIAMPCYYGPRPKTTVAVVGLVIARGLLWPLL